MQISVEEGFEKKAKMCEIILLFGLFITIKIGRN